MPPYGKRQNNDNRKLSNMSITASEKELLKIINEKRGLITMQELSTKAGFETNYTYILCRSLEKQNCIGFFSPTSCIITGKGISIVGELRKNSSALEP